MGMVLHFRLFKVVEERQRFILWMEFLGMACSACYLFYCSVFNFVVFIHVYVMGSWFLIASFNMLKASFFFVVVISCE